MTLKEANSSLMNSSVGLIVIILMPAVPHFTVQYSTIQVREFEKLQWLLQKNRHIEIKLCVRF